VFCLVMRWDRLTDNTYTQHPTTDIACLLHTRSIEPTYRYMMRGLGFCSNGVFGVCWASPVLSERRRGDEDVGVDLGAFEALQ
jgi:hypothetical protein